MSNGIAKVILISLGANFDLKKAKDWIVVYTEIYADKSQAYRRELQIKNWKSKTRIQNLLSKS
jgi:predicted GIY-YIG superfamily endonuclease